MFAQRRGDGFRHFGPAGYARLRAGDGVAEVELIEDPQGPYWSWIDEGGDEPLYVSDSFHDLNHAFLAGDTAAPGPWAEQRAGRGRVVRLQVRELQLAGSR
jgi:hypothetical protein